jgi:hypothetical protein
MPIFDPEIFDVSIFDTEYSLTIVGTELLNFHNFTSANVTSWINLLIAQGIPEFTLRVRAYGDFTDGALDSGEETAAKAIIAASYAAGINVNVDLHSWYTTWDNYLDDDASSHETYRSAYLAYITDAVTKLDVTGVVRFMVLNEPQAQTASTSENNFILSCISTANAATIKPVSVRFMGGYSPSTGHYSSTIDSACDFICRNTYWDARYPTVSKYGSTEAKLLAAQAVAVVQDKEFWITEFGSYKSNTAEQASYVAAFVAYAKTAGFTRIFCWASQPSVSGEDYNLLNGWTPLPAWYELITETGGDPPPATITITASDDAHSTIGPSGAVSVTYGTNKTFTYVADGSYVIDSVTVDSVTQEITGSYTFINAIADHTIVVTSVLGSPPVVNIKAIVVHRILNGE